MSLERFAAARSGDWAALDELIRAAGARPERLGPDRIRRLGALYRAASADLATARRRFGPEPLVDRLEQLVAAARLVVYGGTARQGTLAAFVRHGYWSRVAEAPRALLLAAVLLLAPAGLCAAWGSADPVAASALAPGVLATIGEPGASSDDLGLSAGEQADFSSTIMTNNIRVTFLAFAGGITAGALTVYVLVLNGALLGAVAGIAAAAGNVVPFAALVAPHGVLELSCIVVTGAAGLRLGGALIRPGRRRRVRALAEEGRAAVEVVLGTAPWLVVAGVVEGFVTPAGGGLPFALAVGLGLGIAYWGLVYTRARAFSLR